MQETRTLKVTGESELNFTPDTIAVLLDVTHTELEYDKTLSYIMDMTEKLSSKVAACSLKKEDLKTTQFRIEPSHKSFRDKDGNYHDIFVGYEGKVSFEITFPIDDKILARLLSNITDISSSIRFEYRLSNMQDCKDKVTAQATKTAIHKARLIANASDIKLGSIIDIDYSYGVLRLEEENDYGIRMIEGCADVKGSIHINPEDLKLKDRVTITYEIIE